MSRLDDIRHWFSYHAPSFQQVSRYTALRRSAVELALLIEDQCPSGPDKDAALLRLREAVMLANSAIACDPSTRSEEGPPPRVLPKE